MASARKKQDEKHLKILRELVSLPANKQCFDCHQRGPTYINMTVGSFVCTSCSGLLRGLTPPHRVKSISMASFSPEEVDLVKARGNEYCRRIWLGLYDSNHGPETKDEQQSKDFMIAKYEKKRYYLDPAMAVKNGPLTFVPPGTQTHSRTSTPTPSAAVPEAKPLSTLLGPQSKALVLNTQQTSMTSADNMFTPDKSPSEFLADFGAADPFSSSTQFAPTTAAQPSFANFEDNPIFNSSSMPSAAALTTMGNTLPFASPARKSASSVGLQPVGPPAEDRYAALKDLDSLMKTQQVSSSTSQLSDWSTAPSPAGWPPNGSSMVYGSPPQQGFLPAVQGPYADAVGPPTVNPFNVPVAGGNPWASPPATNGVLNCPSQAAAFGANPFRTPRPGQTGFGASEGAFGWGGVATNGLPNGQLPNGVMPAFHPSMTASLFPTSESFTFPAKTWHTTPAVNPFALGAASPATTAHSSNPFL